MKIILAHPIPHNAAKALAYRFAEEGMLYEFHTSVASFPGSLSSKLQKIRFFSEIKRRNFNSELKSYTRTYPWFEIGRIIFSRVKFSWLTRHEKGLFCVDAVFRAFDARVARNLKKGAENGVTAVYAYEDGALKTFTQAKALGIVCIYDLPIAYWETNRRLISEEAVRLPSWAKTLGGGIKDSKLKLERKTHELELADIVVVPSQFVRDSLPEWAKTKTVVVSPFGTPAAQHVKQLDTDREEDVNRPLRVLFAGLMTQRKGLGDLFSAMRLLNNPNIELVVMGSLQAPMEFYRSEFPDFRYEAGRPNSEVLALMASCDVFCLPSIVEGRALVMQEAMSQGLPLIITPNTGGDDLIKEGVTGYLVPIRAPETIAEKLNWLINNRLKIPEMGNMARLHAKQYTWLKYTDQIVKAIKEFAGK